MHDLEVPQGLAATIQRIDAPVVAARDNLRLAVAIEIDAAHHGADGAAAVELEGRGPHRRAVQAHGAQSAVVAGQEQLVGAIAVEIERRQVVHRYADTERPQHAAGGAVLHDIAGLAAHGQDRLAARPHQGRLREDTPQRRPVDTRRRTADHLDLVDVDGRPGLRPEDDPHGLRLLVAQAQRRHHRLAEVRMRLARGVVTHRLTEALRAAVGADLDLGTVELVGRLLGGLRGPPELQAELRQAA